MAVAPPGEQLFPGTDAVAGEAMFEQGHTRLVVDVKCARKNKDAVELAAEDLGWTTCQDGRSTVVWVLNREDMAERMKKLRRGQWLSHIPGMLEACGKDSLCEALQAQDASFWPHSWRTADTSVEQICADAFTGDQGVLIVKPDVGSQGQGISLARSRGELKKQVKNLMAPAAIIQEYIDPPLLLRGFKWDMRLYVLVMASPQGNLSCFLAREGLARVCLEPYERPDNRNLHRLTVHLTNYSLSKFSDKFIFSENPEDATQGCKRSLSAVLALLEQDTGGRVSAARTWQDLSLLVRQTVGAMTGPLQSAATHPATWEGCCCSPAVLADLAAAKLGQCFQILGMDVLLDAAGKPWLLEVNNNPSLSLDELRPLAAQSRAETNRIFAEAKREGSGPKWGRPCRCAGHPRPHAHHPCAVDIAVKLPVLQGVLTAIGRAHQDGRGSNSSAQRAMWAQGTIFDAL